MSNMQIKCIIIIFNTSHNTSLLYILHTHFCAILFNKTQNLHFAKNFGKIMSTAPSSKLDSQKIYELYDSMQ